MGNDNLTHLDHDGAARMVNVGDKPHTARKAIARGEVVMSADTLAKIEQAALNKGDVIGTARLAGVMAAKRTGDLIPLCHPLPLHHADVEIVADHALPGLQITGTASVTGPTGVEMEALAAVSVAALTIYDMAKAIDKAMTIQNIRLVHKSGGRSGTYNAPGEPDHG
ncbi:MAG: cyclic pyranopterin monophosphate synthase MoaC [Alphaproteobacteria bacterium]|nr:cyclic pyranopterin monophosphate synthase MoaC [Alphaproteobacteria bacterium SS10]